jgi:hypothetical protein
MTGWKRLNHGIVRLLPQSWERVKTDEREAN